MNIEKNTRFFVINKRDLKYDVVLGLDSVVKFRLRLNEKLELSKKEVDVKEEKEIIWNENEMSVNWNEYIQVEEFQIRTGHLDETRKKAVYDLVDRYGGCFAKDKYDIGKVTNYEAHIKVAENCYVAKKPYRCSFDDQQETESQLRELLKYGIIEQSILLLPHQ